MTNIASALKQEIQRVARKEIRSQTEQIRKATSAHRREIAALKRVVRDLTRTNGKLLKKTSKAGTAPREAAPENNQDGRFSAKGLSAQRTRLELSAAELGKLLDVSGQSIYNWEQGKTIPRPSQRSAIAALRTLGKRAARARLDS